jgi:hypothetical protein
MLSDIRKIKIENTAAAANTEISHRSAFCDVKPPLEKGVHHQRQLPEHTLLPVSFHRVRAHTEHEKKESKRNNGRNEKRRHKNLPRNTLKGSTSVSSKSTFVNSGAISLVFRQKDGILDIASGSVFSPRLPAEA